MRGFGVRISDVVRRHRRSETAAYDAAFDRAQRLVLGLALVSLVSILPDLLSRGRGVPLLLSFIALVTLLVSWAIGYFRPFAPVFFDAIDAASFATLAVCLPEAWQAIGFMVSSLWYRSLGSTVRSVFVRVGLYSLATAAVVAIEDGSVSWSETALPTLGLVPLWLATSYVASRLGRMLLEHDAVAAIGVLESALGADVVGESDESTMAALLRASWGELATIVPGLRVMRAELKRGRWIPVDIGGRWSMRPPSIPVTGATPICSWDGITRAPLGLQPHLDEAAGEQCRWGLGPALDTEARSRLLVGIPPQVSDRLATALTAALERSELVRQHALDHLLLGVRARSDELTGLANRLGFFETVERLGEGSGLTSLTFVDLDHFKVVNDTYGHVVGDEVLHGVAVRLREVGRNAISVARLGGDEFAMLFNGDDPKEAEAAGLQLEYALADPIITSRGPVMVGVSWGAARIEGANVTELLASADAAMYRTKRTHRKRAEIERRRGA